MFPKLAKRFLWDVAFLKLMEQAIHFWSCLVAVFLNLTKLLKRSAEIFLKVLELFLLYG
jgi:hypothetical protein